MCKDEFQIYIYPSKYPSKVQWSVWLQKSDFTLNIWIL